MRLSVVAPVLLSSLIAVPSAHAQRPARRPAAAEQSVVRDSSVKSESPSDTVPDSSVTLHTIRINGQTIPYRALAGTLHPAQTTRARPSAGCTTRPTRGPTRTTRAPAAVVHLQRRPGLRDRCGCTWARSAQARRDDRRRAHAAGALHVVDNANSLLDVTDMVFIDPIGTGFSKSVGKGTGKDFWGIDEDATRSAQFISQLRHPQRPLELAQVPPRRELRHHPLGGAGQPAAGTRRDGLQRRGPDLLGARLRDSQLRHRGTTSPTSSTCRATRPPRCTTR